MCQIYKTELYCEEYMFFCGDKAPKYRRCIPVLWTCDGKADCPNSSDEHTKLCSKGKVKNSKLERKLVTIWLEYFSGGLPFYYILSYFHFFKVIR